MDEPRRRGRKRIYSDEEQRERSNASVRRYRNRQMAAGMQCFSRLVHRDDFEFLKSVVDPWLAEQAMLRSEREAEERARAREDEARRRVAEKVQSAGAASGEPSDEPDRDGLSVALQAVRTYLENILHRGLKPRD